MSFYSIKQCENFLRRAKRRYDRALEGFDSAEIERASDQVGKWEYQLQVTRGVSHETAMNRVFGR